MDLGLSNAVSDVFIRFLVMILDVYIRPYKKYGTLNQSPPLVIFLRDISCKVYISTKDIYLELEIYFLQDIYLDKRYMR